MFPTVVFCHFSNDSANFPEEGATGGGGCAALLIVIGLFAVGCEGIGVGLVGYIHASDRQLKQLGEKGSRLKMEDDELLVFEQDEQ